MTKMLTMPGKMQLDFAQEAAQTWIEELKTEYSCTEELTVQSVANVNAVTGLEVMDPNNEPVATDRAFVYVFDNVSRLTLVLEVDTTKGNDNVTVLEAQYSMGHELVHCPVSGSSLLES